MLNVKFVMAHNLKTSLPLRRLIIKVDSKKRIEEKLLKEAFENLVRTIKVVSCNILSKTTLWKGREAKEADEEFYRTVREAAIWSWKAKLVP